MRDWLRRRFWRRQEMLSVPAEHQEARDFIVQMHGVAAPFTLARTTLLYGVSVCRLPMLLGCGVPVNIGDEYFIATAAHVLDWVLRRQGGLYLSSNRDGGRLISLETCPVNRSAFPASQNRQDDNFDLCIIRLTEHVVDQTSESLTFVQIDEIEYDDPVNPGSYYFVHGFPMVGFNLNLFRRTVRCESLPYGTISYTGDRGEWAAADNSLYVDLDFHPHRNVDDSGRLTKLPAPSGISGCGIWRLSAAGVSRAAWSAANIKLVAIEHRWHDQLHVLRGTKFSYVNQIIANNYPDCLRVMNQHWGQ